MRGIHRLRLSRARRDPTQRSCHRDTSVSGSKTGHRPQVAVRPNPRLQPCLMPSPATPNKFTQLMTTWSGKGALVDRDTRRNILTYYLNFLVVALVGFVVNPLLLHALGPLFFGVWKSLQRYLDFATVADGRASQALKWIVANRSLLDEQEKRRDVGAAVIIWFRWLPAAALVAVGIVVCVPLLVKGVPSEAQSMARITAAILAANTVLAGLLALPDSVLNGTNQGYRSMLVSTVAFVFANILMLIVAFMQWPLWSLAIVVLGVAMANSAWTFYIARRFVSWWGIERPARGDVRRVQRYTGWTLGWVVVDKLFLSTELVIVSLMLGAISVTKLTFTTYVMQFVISIALVTASGFMPKLGAELGASNLHAAAERARSVRHLVLGVVALGSAAVLAFNGAFVLLWAGEGQYLGTSINALLVVCGFQLALIRMDSQILDVTLKIAPKVMLGILGSAGGILSGCIAFALSHQLAVSLLSVIGVRLICNIAYPFLVARAVPGSGLPIRPVALAVLILVVSIVIGRLPQSEVLTQAALAVCWLLMAAGMCWLGLVPKETVRALVKRQPK